MTILGEVGIVDKGIYNPDTTYNSGNFVLHNGSTWLALKDNLTGVTPEEGANWKYLARGFASEMLALITAIDSQGLLGSKGAEVTGQALIDKLADMVANKLIQKASMSNVQANDQSKVPTSALAYAMNQSITQNEEAITQLNRDINKIQPGKKLIVESESTPASTIQQWIVDNSESGLTFLSIFSDKSSAFTGEQGNFNIISFGQNPGELTLLIINHWNSHAWIVSVGSDIGSWKWSQLHK